jgi:LEA14-like dessication related protein
MRLAAKTIKRYTYLLGTVVFVLLTASKCMEVKDPEYKGTKDWKITKASEGYLQLNTTIVFYNPNHIGIKLTDVTADIMLSDKKVGDIHQVEVIKIKKESNFEIPISLTFKLADTGGSLLDNAWKFLTNKNVVIQYQGYIQLKKFGIPIKVNMNDQYSLKMSDIKLFK